MNILFAAAGSVAARLVPKIHAELSRLGKVETILTKSARPFSYEKGVRLFKSLGDDDESLYYEREKKVLHIEMRNWADVMVVAPITANTLAKMANGISDGLLTCVLRAWDFKKRLVLAPAMNPLMWEHPVTKEHLHKVESWGAITIPPQVKQLVCGETGIGALADISEIIKPIQLCM